MYVFAKRPKQNHVGRARRFGGRTQATGILRPGGVGGGHWRALLAIPRDVQWKRAAEATVDGDTVQAVWCCNLEVEEAGEVGWKRESRARV